MEPSPDTTWDRHSIPHPTFDFVHDKVCEIALKALRIFLLVAGIALIGASAAMVLTYDRDSQTIALSDNGTLVCEPDTSVGAKGKNQSKCTVSHLFLSPGKATQEYVETVVAGIVGLGLIGTAVAIGQFQKPGPSARRRGMPAQSAYAPSTDQHSSQGQQFGPGVPAGPPGGPYQ